MTINSSARLAGASADRPNRGGGRRIGATVALAVGAGLCQALNGWAFDHSVVEPTRHCHHQGAVPALAYVAGGAALVLTLGGLVMLVGGLLGGRRTAGGGSGRGPAVAIAVVLGAVLGLLLAVDVLALIGELRPATYDPFNCGGM
ncbi:hypothetical protein P3T35_007940 [Kitasatospora sp. GP30]|uniref:hypothetical protein n=1 Tax=Kitasatospora sp. GP30 TaxID=3035084 RepID=UPI000C70F484|nr:hypothetical protein [Kitasatospora sp. GP30]MDH6145879.1 hypothetical protein [Kitasatospora sp. GP30]